MERENELLPFVIVVSLPLSLSEESYHAQVRVSEGGKRPWSWRRKSINVKQINLSCKLWEFHAPIQSSNLDEGQDCHVTFISTATDQAWQPWKVESLNFLERESRKKK